MICIGHGDSRDELAGIRHASIPAFVLVPAEQPSGRAWRWSSD